MDVVQPPNQRGRQKHQPVPVPLLAAGNGSPSVGAYSRTLSPGGPISNPESAYFPGWRASMAAFDPQENRDGPVLRGFDVDCIAQAEATSRLVSRGHYLPFSGPKDGWDRAARHVTQVSKPRPAIRAPLAPSLHYGEGTAMSTAGCKRHTRVNRYCRVVGSEGSRATAPCSS